MPGLLDFIRDPESQKRVGRGLLDAANRGLVANTLGGPVDMATALANLGVAGVGYAGHKAGLLKTPPDLIDPATVPGSSEWIGKKMERAGMVSEDRNPVAEAGFSMLAPVVYKGAQKAGGLLFNAEQKAAQNLAQPSTMRMQGQRGAVNIGGMADDLSYQGQHKPMDPRSGASPLHDLSGALPDDFYTPQGLSFYGSGDPREKAVFRVLQQVRGKPDATVTIYRGVPDGVKKINRGDWVTLSPEYAADYGNVISMKVPARHLTAGADSLLEQGYFPD